MGRSSALPVGGVEGSTYTSDGERISLVQVSGSLDRAIVVAHGFTGNWRQPRVHKAIRAFQSIGTVFAFDFRGHGGSTGECTVGNSEVLDLGAVVRHVRDQGFPSITTVGFSMGGGVALRQAALDRDSDQCVDAVVAVSAPAFWYYRGTRVMRMVHHLVMRPGGRRLMRARGIRLNSTPWPEPPPMQPVEAIAQLGGTPTLIVHGDQDRYFPMEHAHALIAAGEGADSLLVPGFGHAEAAITPETLTDIQKWIVQHTSTDEISGRRPEG
jgi:pimeloyl-ACP methyl ester carboxylesterase